MKSSIAIALLSASLASANLPNLVAETTTSTVSQPFAATITGRVQNAVSGNYLNKARVSLRGTNLITYTDEFGIYRLVGVPEGHVVLQVFYTDLDPQEIPLHVGPGQIIEQDIGLTSAARYGGDPRIVELNAFVVTSDKETDTNAIAINEQRFSPNIKNVIATDSLGDVLGSSAGDFLKFIPGLTAEYDQADVTSISIRGIGGALTTIQADGAPIVSGNINSSRYVEMRTLALNNISRIEVTKVPTPSTPADSLAGSINMVSKSAFERSRAELSFGLNVVGNGENITVKKTPDANYDRNKYKMLPGYDFNYTLPVNRSFGLVVTGMQSNKFNEQNILSPFWNHAGTSTGASVSRPYLQQIQIRDVPREESRAVFSLKADWRLTANSVLSFGGRWSRYRGYTGSLDVTPTVGTNGTPSVTGGTSLSYGPDYVIGATGRGGVTLLGGGQYFVEKSTGANLNYRFDNGRWRIVAGLSRSGSKRTRSNIENGHFLTVTAGLIMPVRVIFSDVGSEGPRNFQAFDNQDRQVDIYDINNFRITGAADNPQVQIAGSKSGNLDIRRSLDWFSFPVAIQTGGAHRLQTLDARRENKSWTFNGPDGNPSTIEPAAPYVYRVYVNQKSSGGYRNFTGISARHLWAAYQENPLLFSQTPAQALAEETFRLTNSEYIEESVSAGYLQAEARLFHNRLHVLTGVRFERTTDEGKGLLVDADAVFVRNADGSFARNAAGDRIRRPEAGAASSIQELRLTRTERGYSAERSYQGYYPSLHFTYNIKENFLARAAYAKTYGRPDFLNIIPSATISEADLDESEINDPNAIRGNINIRNTGLRPWTADNYDLALEYYTPQGGLFSGGVFLKEIDDFFGDSVRIATLADLQEIGLDPRYVGWNLSTKFNAGKARVSGFELNANHSLRALGEWGRYFTVFANLTRLRLEGNPYASFTSFIPKSGNWGASFSWKRITIGAKWNYRGLDKRLPQPALGPEGFTYIKARTLMDLNFMYQLSSRLTLACSINNVANVPLTQMRYAPETPTYARQSSISRYGAAFAIGLKGRF